MENNESLKKAKEEFDTIQNDEYEQRMAELRMKHVLDTKAVEDYGYEKGLKDGVEQGLEQGLEQGERKMKIEIAKKMLMKNKSIEEIMEMTELTKEEIEKLKV